MPENIFFVEARTSVYVALHYQLIELVESCPHVERDLSNDEMVCVIKGRQQFSKNVLKLARKIQCTLANNFEFINCLIDIAPNTFLAKVASNMQKSRWLRVT